MRSGPENFLLAEFEFRLPSAPEFELGALWLRIRVTCNRIFIRSLSRLFEKRIRYATHRKLVEKSTILEAIIKFGSEDFNERMKITYAALTRKVQVRWGFFVGRFLRKTKFRVFP